MEILLLLLPLCALCLILCLAPLSEILGLFFILSSFSVTRWSGSINEIMPFSFIWGIFIVYIIVLGLRFKINIIKTFVSVPEQFRLYFVLLLFGLFSLAGIFFSVDTIATIKRSLGYILNAIFFLSFLPILLWENRDFKVNRFIFYINLSFLIPVSIGLFYLFVYPGEVTYMQGSYMRFTGVYGESRLGLSGNPNAVGYISFILGGVSIIGFFMSKKITGKIFYLSAVIISIISLIASASRTGVLVYGILLAFIFLLKGKTVIKYVSAVCIIVFLFSSLDIIYPIDQIISQVEDLPIFGRLMLMNTGGRTEVWASGLSIMMGTQLLTGHGLGTITSLQNWTFPMYRMQNIYLEIFIETGIIGIILYIIFLWSGLISIYRRWRDSKQYDKNIWVGVLAFYCSLCAYGFSESLLTPANPVFHLLLTLIFISLQPLQKVWDANDTG